eukprot:TRINITY_DN2738_c0_g1_i1.p1 TRINITY_DN2738_c0_g1~~TRINITY_DN2738_c0_g1_i1.p1  ORF type:complete len:416 (-),score=118.85 TRINITY_DN2738_c0_g1_i1:25-1272(-)
MFCRPLRRGLSSSPFSSSSSPSFLSFKTRPSAPGPPSLCLFNASRSRSRSLRNNSYTTTTTTYSPHIVEFGNKILQNNRAALAKAITLVESQKREHRKEAEELLQYVLDIMSKKKSSGAFGGEGEGKGNAGASANGVSGTFRLGISGPPGVGKSSFIESFGSFLTSLNYRVAVLAVDPSSVRTGGSILADKTRMVDLSRDDSAFVRPSPSRGTLGGVTKSTGEAISLCEAAGYNVILIETVGVGQSETAVDELVDMFALLAPPVGGDELQVLKKGVMELADLVVVNKADGALVQQAQKVRDQFQLALHFVTPKSEFWSPKVVMCSALLKQNMEDVWKVATEFKSQMEETGAFQMKRSQQYQLHLWRLINEELLLRVKEHPKIKEILPHLEVAVKYRKISPGKACDQILSLLDSMK